MKVKSLSAILFALILGLGWSSAWADDDHDSQFPDEVSFTTKTTTPFAIEGLTMDQAGNFYTTGRQPDTTKKCPVWKITSAGKRATVGFIPNSPACNPSGIAFDKAGNLYIADAAAGGNVRKVTPHPTGCASDDSSDSACSSIPNSSNFATGVPGTNGVTFDRDGNLWTGDGTTGVGRVWKIAPTGGVCEGGFLGCVEAFRIQPMRNGTALGGDITAAAGAEPTQGVGRQARTFPHTAAGGNPQDLVANGVAFDQRRNLFIADTARGAIWKVVFDRNGNLRNGQVGCDTTFTANTLCLDSIFVAHPLLEGADGIALDVAGNIWVSANERNAVVVVTRNREVIELFRNPANASGLRNAANSPAENNRILELPTSPFLLGKLFCTAQSDGNRRDNFPSSSSVAGVNVGEIGGVGQDKGKISCMDQKLNIPGLPLPVY